jgi:putative ATP-binding cassette transporter
MKPFWVSEKRWSAALLLLIVTALMFASSSLSVFAGRIAGQVTTAMQKHDLHQWSIVMGMCSLVPIILMVTTVTYEFLRTKLALDWRQWYSGFLFHKWYQVHLKMRNDPRIDNPEQVMTQEVESLINTVGGLALTFEAAMVDLFMVVIPLCSIAVVLPVTAFAWSLIGSVTVFLIGRPLMNLNFQRSKTDADLRMTLANLRQGAESGAEVDQSVQALLAEMAVLRRMMYVNRNVSIFLIPFNQLTPIIPILVIAPLFFNSGMEIGMVTTASIAFVRAVNSMTMLVQQFSGVSQLASSIKRVGRFCEVLDEYCDVRKAEQAIA